MGDISINVNFDGITRKISDANFLRGQKAMASQIAADVTQFVPKKKNHLRESQVIAKNGEAIIWNSVYASRQFNAPPGWHYSTPGTGPRWNRRARAQYRDSWKQAFMRGAGIK